MEAKFTLAMPLNIENIYLKKKSKIAFGYISGSDFLQEKLGGSRG